MKPVIAVDIDEVLMPHFADLIRWYNLKFGTALTLHDNHPTDPSNWGTDEVEVAIKRVHQFYDTQDFMNARPFRQARKELSFLSSYYDLVVVTARDTVLEAVTNDWVHTHFKDLFTSIHFTKHYNLEGKRRDKVEVLRELGVSYFIDDSLANIELAAAAGIRCILFGEYVWNQTDPSLENVVRCKNWAAVSSYFEDILAAQLALSTEKQTLERAENQNTARLDELVLTDNFRGRVEAVVAGIPRGRVMTYGQLAALCGNARAARVVGGIAHFGDPALPWQRVVNKTGGLAAGYPGGRQAHAEHLRAEGVAVRDDMTVDVEKLLWWPA